MKKSVILFGLFVASFAYAALTVNTAPTSLVVTPTTMAANAEKAVFEFAYTADATETLSSVAVTVNSTTATASDLALIAVYRDDGDGVFDSGDTLAGSNATVNVGSATTVTTASNNTFSGAKFFVTLKTSATWSGTDSVTLTFPSDGIVASANSPTITAVTTSTITADITGPVLSSAVAHNTGLTSAKEAGDSVSITFSEATNAPTINASNVNTVLVLNNSHSWLDGNGILGSTTWSADSKTLTVTLSGNVSLPTVSSGDTVTVAGSTIKDSNGNNATGSALITGDFTTVPDTTGPVLQSAVAKNTGGTDAKEANDTVEITFNEATNKPVINAANIDTVLVLNNSHSWLDGASAIGSAVWNTSGTILTVTLSSGTSVPTLVIAVPTVAVGDTVTIAGSVIKDAANNNATGSQAITGSFAGTVTTPPSDDDDFGKSCTGGVINGRLYKIGTESTVYLAAACRLKPFRGAAVFHARGHKFQNIIVLSSAPVPVSEKPALPAGGTLVQGSDATVWFVTNTEKKRGFVSEAAFNRLGFSFKSVKKMTDSDLATMPSDTPITITENHPEGSIIKCGNSPTVFEVKHNSRKPFTNPNGFLDRGHSWDVIATVDCGRFSYLQGANLE